MLFWLLFTVFLKSRGMTDNLKHNKSSSMCTFESLVGEEVAKGILLEIQNSRRNDEPEKKRKKCTVDLEKIIENVLIKYFSQLFYMMDTTKQWKWHMTALMKFFNVGYPNLKKITDKVGQHNSIEMEYFDNEVEVCRRLHPLRVISNIWRCHVCDTGIPAAPAELASLASPSLSLAHTIDSKPTLTNLCSSSFGKYGLQDCTGAEYDDEVNEVVVSQPVLTKVTNGNVNTVGELMWDRFNYQIESILAWNSYESMTGDLKKMIPNMTVVERDGITVKTSSLMRLCKTDWLDDEVMNFYMLLLQERDLEKARRIHFSYQRVFFNTFFASKLMNNNENSYENVRKWTNNIELLDMHEIFIPHNVNGSHWILFVINLPDNQISVLDSYHRGADYKHIAKALLVWLQEDVRNKYRSNQSFSTNEWKIELCTCIPKQLNGVDCGVFVLMYADFLSDDLPLEFNQGHMPYFRRKILDNLLQGNLFYKYLVN